MRVIGKVVQKTLEAAIRCRLGNRSDRRGVARPRQFYHRRGNAKLASGERDRLGGCVHAQAPPGAARDYLIEVLQRAFKVVN